MLAQRLVQQSMRRLVARQPSALTLKAPEAIASTSFSNQKRFAATQTISAEEASAKILAQQRLNRPVSPHLGIYKPQITWYGSALNRITGSILSGGFYVFGAAYLIAPALGWHIESASMAAAFATWPVALKFLSKYLIAMPFTYHSFNGLRHLAWDMGQTMSNKAVQQTGWTVVGLTFVSSLVLALL